MINVEFEWFNMAPEIDFHGLKNLLRQLFDIDAQLFDLSALTELVLSQPTIGSTVKVEGKETDPYAFMTILNLHEHKDKDVIKSLVTYLRVKSRQNEALASLAQILESPSNQVGLVLTDRLINIPSEIAPPMYTMLQDEIEAAVEDKEPYEFTHYLIWSRTYVEVASKLDEEDAPKSKKSKAGKGSQEVFYFHPEDEVLQKHALVHGSFDHTKDEDPGRADSKRAFQEAGIKSQGHVILIESAKFDGAVKAISQYLSPPQ